MNKNDAAVENIKNLESKDLGEIFTLLFTDDQFVKNVKTAVNAKTWQFTRQEILSVIEKFTENITWDHLIGTTSVPTLREQILTVKDYRNDVMHAHDIEAKAFRDAKKLFEHVNKQLDSEIRKIIDIAEKNPEETKNSDYNLDLSSVLERYANVFSGLSPVPITGSLTAVPSVSLSDIYNVDLDIPGILKRPQELQGALANFEAIKIDPSVLSQLQGLSSQIENVTAGLQELHVNIPALVQYQDIASKIDIPTIAEALKFQNEVQAIAGGSLGELQRTATLSAENSPTFTGIEKPIISQRPDSFEIKSLLRGD